MHNPSVNDFLDGRLRRNSAERAELVASICTVNQLRLLPEAERIPYVVNLLQDGEIDQFIFLDPQDKSVVIAHCILASGLCIDRYRSELLDYIMHRRYSSFLYNSPLPGGINVRKQLLNTTIWDFYKIKNYFEEDDHLYRFLSFLDLDDGADFICAIDGYFSGKNRVYYALQVERYISDAIDEFCSVDASDYEISLDVESAVLSATSCSPDGSDIDEDDAAATLDECVQEEAFNKLQEIISKLPEHFRHLADHIQEDDIVVVGSDDLVQEYLSNPPGHYEPDDDKDSGTSPYSPIDAIFQR